MSKFKNTISWFVCILIAIIIALLIRYFVCTPTIVKQVSMFPTLKQNQRLILNRISRTLKETPKRGEIVTFEAPSKSYIPASDVDLSNPIAKYENEPEGIFNKFIYYVLEINKTSYIKRVIGLPGEHVKIENGKVYINDNELQEDYLPNNVKTSSDNSFSDLVVPQGYVFVLGDNRAQSTDSRKFGCIPMNKLESKVWIRFWPLNLFGHIN